MNILEKKNLLCYNLSNLTLKKITTENVRTEANKLQLDFSIAKRAWKNFQETGHADLKLLKNGEAAAEPEKKKNMRAHSALYYAETKVLSLDYATASKIVRDYIFTNLKGIEVIRKYGINPHQFYNLIKELNIKGTLLGKKVLDPRQYLKVNLKKVIRFHKKPHLFKTMDLLKQATYKRVLIVLDSYL